ncbi:ferrous iron transporter B [Desulfonatronovibrio hydrogenovorans]|uniref:ferrous iron transporter B n=1 Tax=Desulfonatronovibrio hydrogenovorans TaxID=53245 RepID=UPI00054ECB8E|nr:ferrous iron transporter B [Desulfonatronovibrio hydrogenovorans]
MEGNHILLMGPPNVGKSVIFNLLTGLDAACANYSGTTIDFMVGRIKKRTDGLFLVDVPGTYTLNAANQAELVAVNMLRGKHGPGFQPGFMHCSDGSGDYSCALSPAPVAVVCILDANNLESSLYLLLQVLEFGLPTVAVLNRMDLARDRNLVLDTKKLSRELGIPVIPMVAVRGIGLSGLEDRLNRVISDSSSERTQSFDVSGRWRRAEDLTRQVSRHGPEKSMSKRRLWGQRLIRPWPGLPLALLILVLSFGLVVGLGMQLRQLVLLPLFRQGIIPVIVLGVEALNLPLLPRNILVGEYGFLVKGIEWPFTLVMPYVLSFYGVMALLEDSGYLPRLGMLLDGLLNRIGLQGSSIIPLLLGYGCGIPGILASRSMSSDRERLTVAAMICLAIPCISQTGAFIAMLSERSVTVVAGVFLISVLALILAGIIADRVLKGPRPLTIMEIPELLIPRGDVLLKKIWVQLKRYLTKGALPMILAVGVASILYETGIMAMMGSLMSPLVVHWLRMPEEAAVPLILGIMRRELAVLPLIEMEMTTMQLFVGAVVGLFYVPCIAIVATLAREFSAKTALAMLLLTSMVAFLAGGIIARMEFLVNLISL